MIAEQGWRHPLHFPGRASAGPRSRRLPIPADPHHCSSRLPWPWIDEEKALPWVEKRSGLQLADGQKAAVGLALMAKALVITTARPGVSKTTIVNSILKILAAKDVRLLLCAPTFRAAKRMTRATGVEAKTIRRLLEVDPESGWVQAQRADNPLDCDLLVVDEASMDWLTSC